MSGNQDKKTLTNQRIVVNPIGIWYMKGMQYVHGKSDAYIYIY